MNVRQRWRSRSARQHRLGDVIDRQAPGAIDKTGVHETYLAPHRYPRSRTKPPPPPLSAAQAILRPPLPCSPSQRWPLCKPPPAGASCWTDGATTNAGLLRLPPPIPPPAPRHHDQEKPRQTNATAKATWASKNAPRPSKNVDAGSSSRSPKKDQSKSGQQPHSVGGVGGVICDSEPQKSDGGQRFEQVPPDLMPPGFGHEQRRHRSRHQGEPKNHAYGYHSWSNASSS